MIEHPRIGLVGAGAVGSLLAASLLFNEVPFTWVVRNSRRVEGLSHFVLNQGSEHQRFAVPQRAIVSDVSALPDCDWILIAVKAHQTADVLRTLSNHKSCNVLVAANGLYNESHHLGILYGGAQLNGSTLLVTTGSRLLLGALPGIDESAPELVPILTSPWLVCGANEAIAKRMWHKLCLNCVINPLTALFDRPNGELLAWADSPLVQGVLTEVSAVAEAELGGLWSYSINTIQRALIELMASTASNSSSMREDIHANRETEIRQLNLAVANLGEKHAKPCPLTHSLGIMITAITNRGHDDSV